MDDNFEKVFVCENPPDDKGHKEFICQYRVKLINDQGDQTYTRREMLLTKEDKNGKVSFASFFF